MPLLRFWWHRLSSLWDAGQGRPAHNLGCPARNTGTSNTGSWWHRLSSLCIPRAQACATGWKARLRALYASAVGTVSVARRNAGHPEPYEWPSEPEPTK